ncbi:6-phosphogluconolactonase [Shimia gijangensis]|uniref:6-phosphogluconolactonase n=1 Tax=Shimia gijangensis TaxID=1470563 RepID=A0A1M6RIS4_9RHOB|nr:6-phosphogluconolactonase [Shimia gijangensis]SHK32329.1 6-phosphogluconolactonase [Shimia gijangensis]
MNFLKYPDSEMMAMDVANMLADELGEALHHEERICFAVPGGTTPGPVFDDLCAVDIDWSRVDVVPTDERWVPEDHPRSNARLIKERLLVNKAAKARFLPLCAAQHAPQDVLAELESQIASELPIAVALMGMGADMHTASLFPGAAGLVEALDPHAPILVPVARDDLEEPRVTFSARVLNGALSKHILITGQDKRDALRASRNLPVEKAPIQAILEAATVHWTP